MLNYRSSLNGVMLIIQSSARVVFHLSEKEIGSASVK